MPANVKVTLGLIVLAAVIGGGYYWYSSSKSAPAPVAVNEDASGIPPAHTLPSGSDTSDEALSEDVASVDADVGAMSSDTAAIDAGLNDKEITQ